MRMKIQTAHGTYTRTHKSLVEFYRIEMLACGIVDADAVIRSTANEKEYGSFITSLKKLMKIIRMETINTDNLQRVTTCFR